ncbi:MAG: hypothetical protein ACTSRZ_04185 [Promethearchaeota archaeon]
MKFWAPILHIYQPPTQDYAVLKKINEESYIPLLNVIKNAPNAKVTLNVNGVLLELLLEYNLNETIDLMVELIKEGKIQIMGTAMYHPILPLIPEKETIRQIGLNEEINEKIFKEHWQHQGFFPPELAISDNILKIIIYEGYQWVLAPGISCNDEWPIDQIYQTEDHLCVFFRDDITSNEIAFKKITAEEFVEKVDTLFEDKAENYYMVTAMDGETFGHHHKNYEKSFLEKAFKLINENAEIKIVFVSELIDYFPITKTVKPTAASWSTSPKDLKLNIPYPLWKHPNNPIHKAQYRMMRALDELIGFCDDLASMRSENDEFIEKYRSARYFYDRSLYSCQMWWASVRVAWNPLLIIKGANLMAQAALAAQVALVSLNILDGADAFEQFSEQYHKLFLDLSRESQNIKSLKYK